MANNSTPQSPLSFSSPVHDPECERMVLAAMMTNYNDLAEMEPVLNEDCFHHPANQEIFKAIKTVYASGATPSLVTVRAALSKSGSAIDAATLASLMIDTQVDLNPFPLALRLRDLSYRRPLWEIGTTLIQGGTTETEDIESLHNRAKGQIDTLFDGLSDNVTTLEDAYKEVQMEMLINRDRQPDEIAGTPTGFPQIDDNGGLTGTDLIIIGAGTSQGKTSFATQITLQAIRAGHKIAFYSMEMTPRQIAARISSMVTGINSREVLRGKIDLNDIYRMDAEMEQLNPGNLFFDGRSTASLDSIIASIRKLKMKHDLRGVVIDYLQLVRVSDRGLNREQGVAKVARDLKNLAKELDIWIVALSQLSRGERTQGLPSMSLLRDSGQIEEAADMVIILHRPQNGTSYPEPYRNVSTEGTCLVKIEKGRNTGIGEFICGFRPENTLFYPLNPDHLPTHDSPAAPSPLSPSAIGWTTDLDPNPQEM